MITWWPGVTVCLLHLPLSECRTLVWHRPAAGTAASSGLPQAEDRGLLVVSPGKRSLP
ncbi:hypothetical protein M407DRAFT_193012 [Tulasnella calospora MUT 4182]|uniref:Uncharacterized protein n=1 Tax=Tulasnella calospora MUT 4182 TaxID=1051891 RepID=A0A0C3M0X3_9AGAM|nr:hypothetical protein M407DRAFT_193012 [Tulasnella calospora MUT 4182]